MGRRALTAFGAAIVVTIASCSTGSDSSPSSDAEAVTPATEPASESTTESASGTESASTPNSAGGDADTDPIAATLVPSDAADLPTGSPQELATEQPTTTVRGPLPIPSLQLIDVGQYESPVEVTSRPFDDRTFVVEQVGRVVVVDDLSSNVVLDVTDLTVGSGEQGLLGVAFHPDQDLAYINFTDTDGTTIIAEFAIDPVTAVFDQESFREVLSVEQPFPNHNGGEIAFGPDAMLYIGLGDGGAADDPNRSALDLSSRLGKILRVDPRESGDEPFAIPAGNPFVDVDGADPTIWSLGLRNPWKFSFDSATGDLWIADVGQNEFEEVDFAAATNGRSAGRGLSFGWSAFEGEAKFNDDQPIDGHVAPLLTYSHADGGCSISGGAVYRGSAIADLHGWYVYGDFCSGQIWGYDPTSGPLNPTVVELANLGNLSAIAIGGEGEMYAVSTAGTMSRLAAA